MKQSLTYYITLSILKLKGIKNDFSKDPIDFGKIRKADVKHPTGKILKQNQVRTFQIATTLITELKQKNTSGELLLFIPGGAFISGPANHHWDTLHQIIKQTNHTGWMCDYPKAPEHKILEISHNIDLVYEAALKIYPSKQITLIGDSAGGTLIAALTQRLIRDKIALPKQLILVSPVMHATMSNTQIKEIEPVDPMLSRTGVFSAKKMCADNGNTEHPMISPLNLGFDGFPRTILFLAENDITYPDQLLFIQKLQEAKVEVKTYIGSNMPHIWPLLPVMKEAKVALSKLINHLKTNLAETQLAL
ncbi:alpha/beta hydrolase [Pontibacter arcticus]|uniref:Esterase n=1 Tax=Pontibacter arcticus TaxID=2080288 RepID=A0A364RGP7_9BACT|nr:alpha/beta hydrolase [Pontibacter arcticus]RAU83453.1 esterase [Pontibacter arcticus]